MCQKRKFTDTRLNRRFSLKADVSENKQGTALENFETSTFCQKAKNACTTHFAFKESIGY